MSVTTVIRNAHIVTMDEQRRELTGSVVLEGNRITAVGDEPADLPERATIIDGRGCLLTPGLVNTHHHLYQWMTRGHAAHLDLFHWLVTLYPRWSELTRDTAYTAAIASLVRLAATGCTTTTDHHYVFPRHGDKGARADMLGSEIPAAAAIGMRFHPPRGSMDLGRSQGGLPPDSLVEPLRDILAASEKALTEWHDASPGSMLRIGLAPCSPFSASADLMRETAAPARDYGARLHTHLSETREEVEFCRSNLGGSPLDYVAELGWTGPDVWFAHAVHLEDREIVLLADTRTGVAHCPTSNARLGAGIARLRDLVRAGVPVGLGVDGAASNEGTSLIEEVRHALLFARARDGAAALTARQALELATLGGARVLGRANDIGSIEEGKLADLALWRMDTLPHSGIDDPVVALVMGAAPPLERLIVDGRIIVENGEVTTVDAEKAAKVVLTAQLVMARGHNG
ncbi:8-oxoguanine deaminase [Hoyosella sp. G463]|uniref:8-oxoguanine deaminase n=1 Tax=Lolliginicoccus lacisalsi TaxID=2742202 RepID=A0A927PMU9_9ACTN|nr:8-oxoguanine deaminase [Lolliginicoccus lacisalsi]MBD8507142.1 8-oxoguanine deaminase [Lolliginicoccus lacisalsi]